MIELTWLLPLILFAVIVEGWFIYEGRPRGPKVSNAKHLHRGPVRSQHEEGGRTVYVYECHRCGIHFSGIH